MYCNTACFLTWILNSFDTKDFEVTAVLVCVHCPKRLWPPELRRCVKVEVAVLGSPSQIVLSVD